MPRSRFILILRCAILLALLIGIYWGWTTLRNPEIFPIKTVKIKSDYQHVNGDDLEKIILPYAKQGFFNLNVEQLEQQLLQSPWIASAAINRVWPATITITITEQQAVARWDNNALLNNQGLIFTPPLSTFPKGLPLLTGTDTESQKLWQLYGQMSALLMPLKLKITELDANARDSLTLLLDNGALLELGREDDALSRLQRFAAVYPKVFTNPAQQAQYVDLRYNNGFAIDWKPVTKAQKPKK